MCIRDSARHVPSITKNHSIAYQTKLNHAKPYQTLSKHEFWAYRWKQKNSACPKDQHYAFHIWQYDKQSLCAYTWKQKLFSMYQGSTLSIWHMTARQHDNSMIFWTFLVSTCCQMTFDIFILNNIHYKIVHVLNVQAIKNAYSMIKWYFTLDDCVSICFTLNPQTQFAFPDALCIMYLTGFLSQWNMPPVYTRLLWNMKNYSNLKTLFW